MKTDLSHKFAALFRDIPLQRLFANMNACAEVLNIDGLDIPYTVIDRDASVPPTKALPVVEVDGHADA